MMRSRVLAVMLLPLSLAACMEGGPGRNTVAAVPTAQVIGPPQSCIPINQIRESRIRDDSTIDFISNGRKTWRVSLTSPCPGLKSEDKFSYETSLSQLCSTDIIYVLHDYGGQIQKGPGCGLNQFVPVELAPK